jgi:hypothetical protein
MTRARDLASTALNSTVNTTELGYLDGVTSSVQTQLDAKLATATASSTYATSSTVTTHTGASTGVHGASGSVVGTTDAQTLSAKVYTGPMETVQVVGALGGTNLIYAKNYGFAFSNVSATSNITLNVSGDGSTTLNSWLAIGSAYTLSLLVSNGVTPYVVSALQIDSSAQTIKWSGGTAPSAGNASSIDAYSFTIIKTASATYTVLGAGPVKYA